MLRARWVTLRARWVTLRAHWVTLRARWVTLRARWVTLRARRVAKSSPGDAKPPSVMDTIKPPAGDTATAVLEHERMRAGYTKSVISAQASHRERVSSNRQPKRSSLIPGSVRALTLRRARILRVPSQLNVQVSLTELAL